MDKSLKPARRVRLFVRLILLAEYFVRIAWLPFSVVCLFMALAAADILPSLPPWVHAAIVAIFAAAFAYSLRQGILRHRWPTSADVLRRIEADNQLLHRPFDVLADRSVGATGESKAIWTLHRKRADQTLSSLRIKGPRSHLAAHDTYAWRGLTVILLIVGLLVSRDRFGERLDAALSPPVLGSVALRDIALDVWITPPDYTGEPPIILSRLPDGDNDAVDVPAGSRIEANVSGGKARPHMTINGKRQKFTALGPHSFQFTALVQSGDDIVVTQGFRTLGRWRMTLLDPAAPIISWIQPPTTGKNWTTELDYRAADQYGLADISATITLADEVKPQMLPKDTALDKPGADTLILPLPDASSHPKSLKLASLQDWTANPWAGFPVHLTLTATGLSGLSAVTAEQSVILPERRFNNPTAIAIIAERKRLTLDPKGERASIAGKIAALGSQPDVFGNDAVVFLALRTAAVRLWGSSDLAEIPTVQDLLWNAAVRIEDGAKGDAEKAVANAAAALRQALDRGAPQDEIDQLSRALKQAMNRYLDALQKDLQERMARGEQVPVMPPGLSRNTLNRDDLNQMVDKLTGLSRDGQRNAAQDLLSQLDDTMRSLRAIDHNAAYSKAMQALDAMHKLKQLTERQQALQMETYNNAKHPPADTGSVEQQAVKTGVEAEEKRLNDLGIKSPDSLKQAERDMEEASKQLGQSKFAEALPHQNEALNNLRQALQDMADKMQQQGTGMSLNEDQEDSSGESGKDPFGRPDGNSGFGDDGKVRLPDQSDQQKSRTILDELRKRSGERFRAKTEHDYIDRLLKGY